MISKKKILVVTGTRAEYGLLKSSIDELLKSKNLEMQLLVTGTHTIEKYGHTIDEIRRDNIPINCVVKISGDDDMLTALSKEIIGIKDYCQKEKPDMILILGDRDEPFAAAIVGGHLGIPIAHIHGGDISGGVDNYIRHSITKFAHLHFAGSKKSYKRILSMGEEKWRIFNIGTPGLDNFKKEKYLNKKKLSNLLNINLSKKWFLMLQHPLPLDTISIENQINPTIDAISQYEDAEKIIIYPNSDTGNEIIIEKINKFLNNKKYHIYKNLNRTIYLSLLKYCDILIGNSSSGIIESTFFKLPTINIGDRQFGRECGKNVIHTDYKKQEIKKAIDLCLSIKFKKMASQTRSPYGKGFAGKKIIHFLENIPYDKKLLSKNYNI